MRCSGITNDPTDTRAPQGVPPSTNCPGLVTESGTQPNQDQTEDKISVNTAKFDADKFLEEMTHLLFVTKKGTSKSANRPPS